MTQVTYSGLTPGAPENVNDLNTKLIELKTIINGNLDAANLAANSVGTSELVDGSVTAAKLASAVGAPLAVTSQVAVGVTGQTATGLYPGRILAATDFTGLGLSAPTALYNLSSVSDSSGNGRTLTNKGSVTFDTGITGSASTAAVFTGSTGQALYIADTGAADPFRIKTGSWGCWLRTAKRATFQSVMGKDTNGAGARSWSLIVSNTNVMIARTSVDGTNYIDATGATDLADDRWHHIVAVYDGTILRLYVDGSLEATASATGAMFGAAAPFNIGGIAADAVTAAANPHFGRVDEGFVTSDVLSDDQVRFLYCSKIAHAYPATPKQSWVQVRRQRRGADLATTDFPSTPVRLYAGGSLTDLGSGATNLTANNTPVILGGPDGVSTKGYNFVSASSQSLSSTDTGLPSALTSRTIGCWVKTSTLAAEIAIGYGSGVNIFDIGAGSTGFLTTSDGSSNIVGNFIADGRWHFIVFVGDNAAVDGLKSKAYCDGVLVGSITTLNSTTLGGANAFRVGASPGATLFWNGQVACPFVHSSALTAPQIAVLYDKSVQQLTNSPKNEGEHIEGMDATYLYLDMASLASNTLVDIQVQG